MFAATGLSGGYVSAQTNSSAAEVPEPKPNREFRAAWIATVANIDWPSKRGLPTEQQKQEMVDILDKCVDLNLNAVVLQVRPACDAIYESKIEPWSDVLTGEMGKAPEPFYDPLTFTLEEAHKRGIEVHCWFNPYRALHTSSKGKVSDNHISKTNPEIAKKYGDYYWLNPTDKRTQDLSMDVIMDVVNRYDIDGVHMDDYFYPYPEYGKGADFPDDDTWKAYQDAGGKLNRGDWRREAVNNFVERLYKEVKKAKAHVKVGISPFGIARPGNPPEVQSGFDQYATLYADAKLWLNKGWVDYYTPQLYWPIASPQPYMHLLKWWMDENTENRHMWPGLYTSKYAGTSETVNELPTQVVATRFLGATGNVHFSMKPLMTNVTGNADLLKRLVYAEPALVPASPWLDDKAPSTPELTIDKDAAEAADSTGTVVLNWKKDGEEDPWVWALYTLKGKKWNMQVLPSTSSTLTLKADDKGVLPREVRLSAVDRNGNESERARLTVNVSSKVSVEDAKPTEGQVK